MTLVAGSKVGYAGRPESRRALWRPTMALRLWQRRLAHRRFVRRVLAETQDPALLADMGIPSPRPSQVERWVMAMLWHQH